MPVTAVNVLNNNSFPLDDRYGGVLYRFEPGRAITIPVEAAKHILGTDSTQHFLPPCREPLGLEH